MLGAVPIYCDVPKEEMDIPPPQAKCCKPFRTMKIGETSIDGRWKMMPIWAPLRTRSQHMVGFGYSWSSGLQASGLCCFFPPGSPVLATDSLSGLLPWQTVRLLSFFSSSSVLSPQNILVCHLSTFLLSDLHNSCGVSRPFDLLNLCDLQEELQRENMQGWPTQKGGVISNRSHLSTLTIVILFPLCHHAFFDYSDLTWHCTVSDFSLQIWFQESQTPVGMDKMILYLS